MASVASRIEGRLLGCGHGIAYGWAWDPSRPRHRLDVDVLDELGGTVACGRAARFSSHLLELAKGDGFHLFVVHVPLATAPRPDTSVTVRVAGTGETLPGGPYRLRSDAGLRLAQLEEIPAIRLATAYLVPEAVVVGADGPMLLRLSAFDPPGRLEFANEVPGEGWSERTGAGRRVGFTGTGTIRLTGLLEREAFVDIAYTDTKSIGIDKFRLSVDDQTLHRVRDAVHVDGNRLARFILPRTDRLMGPRTLRVAERTGSLSFLNLTICFSNKTETVARQSKGQPVAFGD